MKKCTRCGAENPDNGIWCIGCRKSLLRSPEDTAKAALFSEESTLRGDLGKQETHNGESVGGMGNHASDIANSRTKDENPWDGRGRKGASVPNGVTYCSNCGKPIANGARYCSHCGHSREGVVPNDCPPRKPRIWRWVALLAALAISVSLICSIPIYLRITDATNDSQAYNTVLSAHFTDRKIMDEVSAREAIQDVAGLLGITSVHEELEIAEYSEVLGDTYYSFQQMYQGIPVYGKRVVVSADADGNAQMLSSGYHSMSGILNTPKFTEADALTAASGLYSSDNDMESYGLVIYTPSEGEPELAWEIYCSGEVVEDICFISAINGRLLGTNSLLRTDVVKASGTDILDNVFGGDDTDDTLYCRSNEDGKYELADEVRSIVVNNSNGFSLSKFKQIYGIIDENNNFYQHKHGSWFDEHGNEVIIDGSEDGQFRITNKQGAVISGNGTWAFNFKVNNPFGKVSHVISNTPYFEDKQAVTVMTRTEAVSDFYQEMFKRHGFDGEGGTTWAFYNDNINWDVTNAYAHSTMYFPGAIIVFGKESSLSDDLVAHEYTHNVQGSICNLTYSGESGALMEAYADIFGELFEKWYTGDCDWIHDGGRNIEDPAAGWTSNGKRYPTKYQGENWKNPEKLSDDHGGVHTNCMVISHAAWMMTQPSVNTEKYETLSTYDLAQLFYKALYGIANADITFREFRSVLTYTAYSLCQNGQLTAKQVAMVDWAMSKAGIPNSLLLDENDQCLLSIDRRAKLFVYRQDGALCDYYDLSITCLDMDTLPVEYTEDLPRAESYHYSIREQDAFQINLEPGVYEFTLIDPSGQEPSETEYLRVVEKDGLAGYPFYPGFKSSAGALSWVSIPECFSCITVSVGIADWKIYPDSDDSFKGVFKLWNWGDNGPGYSKGTCYISEFSADFTKIEKVSTYSYKMIVDNIVNARQAGETYFDDETHFVVESKTGIEDGTEFYLFLPGTPQSELPQGLVDSVNNNGAHSMSEITADTYVLYAPNPEASGYELVFISTADDDTAINQSITGADRRLTSLTTYSGKESIWYRHLFSWDENGRLIRVQDVTDWNNVRTWTFQYNERGQLLREDQSSAGYSFACQENTYSADGKLLCSRAATEDSYEESTYQYDSSGRLFKVIQTDDYCSRETTVTEYNGEGKPTREERVETVLSTGEQSRATEQIEYDELGRETKWRYSGTDGEYGMTYRYDIKPFAICTYETGGYTLLLENEDGTSSWTIDVGVHYTPLEDNGVLNFRNANADVGTLEADADGYLTRISYKDGAYFEFEYSSSAENGTK